MRKFDFKVVYQKLVCPEILGYLTKIHEFKGRQKFLTETKPNELAKLLEIAQIQSTDASNRIEGIITTDDRIKNLALDKTEPKNRNEHEIAGYRDVLKMIHENYEYIFPRPSFILQMHRDLYKFSGSSAGGTYKSSDNIIAENRPDGTRVVRFQPMAAWETQDAMNGLCTAFNDAIGDESMDPLILIPVFIFDFLCIHPFNDGNGRMSRLLTLLLLYRAGYIVGKYISIEKLISDTKDTYYEVLQQSSVDWHDGQNDYLPFVSYMLGIILAAYRDFDSKMSLLDSRLSKPDRVREIIKNRLGKITKSEIIQLCPDISQVTVQRTLSELVKKGDIQKISGGRYTSYAWIGEK